MRRPSSTGDPAGPVPVREWERWYVPGVDGGAHPQAMEALGATSDSTVTWDDVTAAMIDFSDNAAADLLRATLGDAALTAAAAEAGWTDVDLPVIAGEGLLALAPPPAGTDRRAATTAAGRAYADGDPAQHALAAGYVTPPADMTEQEAVTGIEAALAYWDGAWAGTTTQLADLHRAAATDALGPGVSAIVRRHLERQLAGVLPAGVVGAGQKGGSLPGILTHAVTVRREDGTVGVAVVNLSGLPWQQYQEALASGAPLLLSQQALVDPTVLDRLRTAVAA